MPAAKALLIVLVAAVVLAAGVFTFVPGSRPGFVKGWFRKMAGLTPARTPTECMDRFKDCLQKRDYETGAELYCAGEYREQVLKGAAGGKKLGEAIDNLAYAMDKNGVVNDKTKLTLRLLEPFPRSYRVLDVKESGNTAVATIGDADPAPKVDTPLPPEFFTKHGLLVASLMPAAAVVHVPLIKDAAGNWKINFPVETRLRESVEYLKTNATNYANAIAQVRDEVKNNPVTKEQVQVELERRLNESK